MAQALKASIPLAVMAYTTGDAIPADWLEGDAIALARLYASTVLA